MIAEIRCRKGKVMGRTEITGTRWVAGHDGFLNDDVICIDINRSGIPCAVYLLDLMGRPIINQSTIRLTNHAGTVGRGCILRLPRESIVLTLVVREKTEIANAQ